MWSRPAVVTPREYASPAGLERHRGPEPALSRRDLTHRLLAPHLQPVIGESALVVVFAGAGLVAASPS